MKIDVDLRMTQVHETNILALIIIQVGLLMGPLLHVSPLMNPYHYLFKFQSKGQAQLLHAYTQLFQAHKQLLAQSSQARNGSSAHQRSNSTRQPNRGTTGTPGLGTSVGQQVHAHVAQFGNSGYNSGHGDWNSTQETALPQAFSTLTLQDFGDAGWNMDTGASLHLTSNANNLSSIFNERIFPQPPPPF